VSGTHGKKNIDNLATGRSATEEEGGAELERKRVDSINDKEEDAFKGSADHKK
jgi:hypothetical protein